jgi:hypothetical protein
MRIPELQGGSSMKKLAAVALAATLALGGTAATMTAASAGDRYDRGHRHGIELGWEVDFHWRVRLFAGGYHDHDRNHYHRSGSTWERHVAACHARYRSYDASRDAYRGYDGRWHLCRTGR